MSPIRRASSIINPYFDVTQREGSASLPSPHLPLLPFFTVGLVECHVTDVKVFIPRLFTEYQVVRNKKVSGWSSCEVENGAPWICIEKSEIPLCWVYLILYTSRGQWCYLCQVATHVAPLLCCFILDNHTIAIAQSNIESHPIFLWIKLYKNFIRHQAPILT